MNGIILLSIGLAFAMLAAVAIMLIKRQRLLQHRGAHSIRPRCVINTHEQPTFLRLKKALPDCYILAQVSHATLVSALSASIRDKINQNHADFVVLDHKFKVVAIIDLDDASHKGALERSTARNKYLLQAGYRVITYTATPDIELIKADFVMQPPSFQDAYAEYYDDL